MGFTTRVRWASSRRGSLRTRIAWTTWSACAGRTAEYVNLIEDHCDGLIRAHLLSWSGLLLVVFGVGEAVGIGSGFDDVAAEGESVDDRGAESGVGECFRPAREGLVGRVKQLVVLASFMPCCKHLRRQLAAGVRAQQPVVVETAQSTTSEPLTGASGHQAVGLSRQRPRPGGELLDRLGGVPSPGFLVTLTQPAA